MVGIAKKNTGKRFEQITQEIYQAFLNFDCAELGVKTITVQHNVVLKGISGNTHQIDVYWEFELAGTIYKTLVEVKDWKTPVKQEQLHSFKSVIQDIPGAANGIFVSKSGFQDGAKVFAESNGIKLIQITEDEQKPYLNVHISLTTTHYCDVALVVDQSWLDAEEGREELFKKILPKKSFEKTRILTPKKETVNLCEMMCNDAIPYYFSPDYERHHLEMQLDGEWFWITEDVSLPYIKIEAYEFVCYNTSGKSSLCVTHKDLAFFHIKDILQRTEHSYNALTKVIRKKSTPTE